jgi:hypothetical protein
MLDTMGNLHRKDTKYWKLTNPGRYTYSLVFAADMYGKFAANNPSVNTWITYDCLCSYRFQV